MEKPSAIIGNNSTVYLHFTGIGGATQRMIDINLHTNTQIYNPITGAQKINPAKSRIKKRKPKEEERR